LLKKQEKQSVYLEALGLSEIPSLSELKKAYHRTMLIAHPDKGGSEAEAKIVIEAYEILKEVINN